MSGDPETVVLATGNPGKLREFQALLGADWSLIPQSEFDIDGVEETGATFTDNALLKARYAAAKTGLGAIADDSGLEVDALEEALHPRAHVDGLDGAERMLGTEAQQAELSALRGQAFLASGKRAQAKDYFDRAMKLDPKIGLGSFKLPHLTRKAVNEFRDDLLSYGRKLVTG